jgi:hypothetical protein
MLVSGVRREEDEASLPPIECSAARMDTVYSVGDGEWGEPGCHNPTRLDVGNLPDPGASIYARRSRRPISGAAE